MNIAITKKLESATGLMAGLALALILASPASAALVDGQWLQLNFTNGTSPAAHDNFNIYASLNSGTNSATGNTTMIDSTGNVVPGISLSAANWTQSVSNTAAWSGNGTSTPAAAAGQGSSTWSVEESGGLWRSSGFSLPNPVGQIAVNNLDPNLRYNVYIYSKYDQASTSTLTANLNGVATFNDHKGASQTARFASNSYDIAITSAVLNGSNQLEVDFLRASPPTETNPPLTAMVIEAYGKPVVSDPSTILTPVDTSRSSALNATLDAPRLIDSSGLTTTPAVPVTSQMHSNTPANSWLSANTSSLGGVGSQWVAFDLGGEFDLSEIYIWNYDQDDSGGDLSTRGVREFKLQVSSDTDLATATWTDLAGDPTFTTFRGPSVNPFGSVLFDEIADAIQFDADGVRLVRLNVVSNYGDPNFVGLAEVRFGGTPTAAAAAVPEPGTLVIFLEMAGILAVGAVWRNFRRRLTNTQA